METSIKERGECEENRFSAKKSPNLNREKIKYILLTDILFRAPVFGIIVLAALGGLAYLFVWLILNVIEPALKNNI